MILMEEQENETFLISFNVRCINKYFREHEIHNDEIVNAIKKYGHTLKKKYVIDAGQKRIGVLCEGDIDRVAAGVLDPVWPPIWDKLGIMQQTVKTERVNSKLASIAQEALEWLDEQKEVA